MFLLYKFVLFIKSLIIKYSFISYICLIGATSNFKYTLKFIYKSLALFFYCFLLAKAFTIFPSELPWLINFGQDLNIPEVLAFAALINNNINKINL